MSPSSRAEISSLSAAVLALASIASITFVLPTVKLPLTLVLPTVKLPLTLVLPSNVIPLPLPVAVSAGIPYGPPIG